jgi:hypothetical protein
MLSALRVYLFLIVLAYSAYAGNVTCSVCGIRVAGGYIPLDDGRFICKKDAPDVVLDQNRAEEIFSAAKAWGHKTLSGYGSLPDQNIAVVLQNKTLFDVTVREWSAKRPDINFAGFTRNHTNGGGGFTHEVFLLSGRLKKGVANVSVHEFGHTWLGENARSHKLSEDAKEGFCDWLKYKFEVEQADTAAQARTLKSDYTRGQIQAFVAAEKAHGLERVVQWTKAGEDAQIDLQQLDRVMVLRERRPAPATVASTTPAPLFDSMPVFARTAYTNAVLKGLSGSASRRFAVINDQTFAAKESGKIRMGGSNVVLRCLDIGEASVLVQIQGEAGPRTLSLSSRP